MSDNPLISRKVIVLYGVKSRNGSWLRGAVWTKDVTATSRFSKEVAQKIASSSGGVAAVLPAEAFPDGGS